MAQRVDVLIIDDLHYWRSEGTEEVPADETIEFAFGGHRYKIDLSKEHAEEFREVMNPYVQAASQKLPRNGSRSRPASSRQRSREIRVWARKKGYEISDRGRIPESVVAEYEAAR